MLSTGRLLCARRIRLDVKYIEGAKCSFHVCSVANGTKIRSHVLHRKLFPASSLVVNFASSDASASQAAANFSSTASATVESPVLNPELVSTVLPSDAVGEAASIAGQIAAEPSLASIGLGSWTPVGMVQRSLEFFHITLDLPWWGSIALGTLIIRLLIFPLVIIGQRNAAKMNNCLPEMQALQVKMSEARQRGDKLDAAMHAHELVKFMGEKGVNPLKNSLVPLCQAPFFISMFMGIRGMANAPVDSFRQGGMYWFTDLTVPDEFYLLPIITSATLALTIEVGTDMGKLHSMGMARYVLRGLPLLILPFTFSFPAGVLVYWVSTNFISLVQVAVLRVPKVRNYFNIEQLVKIDKTTLPMQQKGFVGGMKESWTNLKISRELQDRERIDNANFQRAGRGAVKKTYKFDPTQPQTARKVSSLGIQVKSRDS